MGKTRRTAISRAEVLLPPRHRLLLELLDALGGKCENLDFQKVLFLYCQEPESGRSYDFVPYKKGAFSFTSYADRRRLIGAGLLEPHEASWVLNENGRRALKGGRNLLIQAFVREIGDLRGDLLVAETYRRFPFYATRSEIAEKVLKNEIDALSQIRNLIPTGATAAIQTVGYEGHTLESYLNELFKAGVTLLCDVRRNPISRKYGFSKGTLSNACEHLGIRYEHLPELGIPSDQRQDLNTQADYDALFKRYESKWLPKQRLALEKIKDWADEGYFVALTCFEHQPTQCHRHCVSDALETGFGERYRARHL